MNNLKLCKVSQISKLTDVPKLLRQLADDIESGEVEANRATVVAGRGVYCFGPANDNLAVELAVFDMSYGIDSIMRMVE